MSHLQLEIPDFLRPLLGSRDPHAVYHIRAPKFHPKLKHLRFEYHPISKTIFFMREGSKIAERVCGDISSKEEARFAVLIWLRGYLEGDADASAKAG